MGVVRFIEWCGKHPFATGLFAIIGILGFAFSIYAFQVDRRESAEGERIAAEAQSSLAEISARVAGDPVRYPSDAEIRQLADLSTFTECDACPEMVVIPAGRFLMGSPSNEQGRLPNEGPQSTISVARLAVSRFEITFSQWEACLADGGCNGFRPGDEGWGRGDRPVISVSWDDAQSYVRWLSGRTGQVYRLLTESEWEYAARGGSVGRYSNNGDEASLCSIANHSDQMASSEGRNRACNDGVGDRSAPVGRYAPNGFGLYDMHGNVWEWVEDCYRDSLRDQSSAGEAFSSRLCLQHVIRGGSFFQPAAGVRSASRRGSTRGIDQGLRVARAL